MLLDAHAHVDMYEESELSQVLAEMRSSRILTIANSMDFPSYEKVRALARQSRLVVPAFGVHPWNAHLYTGHLEQIRQLAVNEPVIGEIGLDYHWVKDRSLYPAQHAVLNAALTEAAQGDHLLSVHTKGAEADVVALLERFSLNRVIIHWYSGDRDNLRRFVDIGCYFSVVPAIVNDEMQQEIVRQIPNDRLLSETDNPGRRDATGKVGMPRQVRDSVRGIATLKGLSIDETEALILDNFRRVTRGLDLPEVW